MGEGECWARSAFVADGEWVKLNAEQIGAFRVGHAPELWARLAAAARMSPSSVSCLNCLALVCAGGRVGEGERGADGRIPRGLRAGAVGAPGGRRARVNQAKTAVLNALRWYTQAGEWVKANAGQTGAFRVAYAPELWARLAAAARVSPKPGQAGAPGLPPADVAGLLDDTWALAQAGAAPISAFLNLTRRAPRAMLMP